MPLDFPKLPVHGLGVRCNRTRRGCPKFQRRVLCSEVYDLGCKTDVDTSNGFDAKGRRVIRAPIAFFRRFVF